MGALSARACQSQHCDINCLLLVLLFVVGHGDTSYLEIKTEFENRISSHMLVHWCDMVDTIKGTSSDISIILSSYKSLASGESPPSCEEGSIFLYICN